VRVLIAARLSRLADGQTGLDSQDAESTRWALANGHEIVHVAADTKSGTSAPWDRPNLRPWVTEPAKLAEYDAVVAYKLDRLSRGDNASTNAIETWAHANHKQLLTVDGLVFPCEGADGIRWDLAKRLSHQEWLNTSERYKRMQAHLVSQGKLVGKPPWGYESAPAEGGHKMLVPTDEGRAYIPAIFARVIAGESLNDVAEWLNAEGVKPAIGDSWWGRRVGAIIRNTTYAGRRRAQSGRAVLRVEPLIDADTFRRAGAALDSRPKRGPQNAEDRAMLAEVVYCARCADSPMYRVRPSGNNWYYRCYGRGSQRQGCGNYINGAVADDLVARFMSNFDGPIVEARVIPGTGHQAEIAEIELDIRSLDMTDPEYPARHAELWAERQRLAGLGDVPDRTVWEATGRTHAGEWAALDGAERGAWLRAKRIRVFAIRPDVASLVEPAWALRALGAASVVTGDGVTMAITWRGSDLDTYEADDGD
jgi:site-specific DNA recombinase